MILTQCAVCATDLGLSLGKKCGRCSTRYCGPECQKQHWEGGGHDKLCKKIKRAGGAEQHYADTKYSEAVTVAAEACADDTKGQTCFICTQALHWKTKEGLVRGCSCRGTAGFAHVSCLAEQAKILCDEAEENNLDMKVFNERWRRWHTCGLCEQEYHGVVCCALGWACWKTYVGRPETDQPRLAAMTQLGNGLSAVGRHEDALSAREAELSMKRRVGAPEHQVLIAQGNLACTYDDLGRVAEVLSLRQEVYSGTLKLHGEEHYDTLREAYNYASSLMILSRFEEAKSLLRKMIPVARRFLGESHDLTLHMNKVYAVALFEDDGSTLEDLREAVGTLEDATQTARRVFGAAHPLVFTFDCALEASRAALRARETPSGK
jgi:hypothetical protein